MIPFTWRILYIETRQGGPPTPLRIGNINPMGVAGLTNSRTEGSFLKSEAWQGQKNKALEEETLRRDQKASYNILIIEVPIYPVLIEGQCP